jgi:hypothetical protein
MAISELNITHSCVRAQDLAPLRYGNFTARNYRISDLIYGIDPGEGDIVPLDAVGLVSALVLACISLETFWAALTY